MTLLNELKKPEVWKEFLEYKLERNQLTRREIKDLSSFIDEERFLGISSFGIVRKKIISKIDSQKKRTVYTYNEDETWILKLLAHLLYKYDEKCCPNCYSFRKHISAKNAVDDLLKIKDLDTKFTLKLDIHNYFNSIDVSLLMGILSEIIDDDEDLLEFIGNILNDDRCMYNGEILHEQKGAMAGIPLASFLANFYLKSLDSLFIQMNIPYFRYSDDILIICDSENDAFRLYSLVKEHIEKMHLSLNEDKFVITKPGDPITFLGLKYINGNIDLADITIEKMKGKIRRKANRIYRNGKKKSLSFEAMAKRMIRTFDIKFYDLAGENKYTWTRWYFPVITASEGLKIIDEYMVMYLRYLYSGRHYKGNYKVSYDYLKKIGYTSLVNEYYTWKRDSIRYNEI